MQPLEGPVTEAQLVEVAGLTKHFGKAPALVHAVENVSFSIRRGEVVGLVGESGSGKSTIGRLVLRSVDATAGTITFDGTRIDTLSQGALRPLRRRMQMVFQDPYASLNPRLRVRSIIGESLDAHQLARGAARERRIGDLLEIVGLQAAHADRYPHEFSGGQRQRIGIARALAVEPDLIIADEPVSALDVSVQAQVLNLLQDLRRQFDMAMLFISHDLDVVELMCDRVIVLYLGRIMEVGSVEDICRSPQHPYTQALLAASPRPDPDAPRVRRLLQGDMPSPLSPPSGCVFRTRCPQAVASCATSIPPLREIGDGHKVACILDDLGFGTKVEVSTA
jgi:peptide/nickel transport system ATP-binding protein